MKELEWPTVTGTVLVLVPKPGTPYSQQTGIVGQPGGSTVGFSLRQSDVMRLQTITQRWNKCLLFHRTRQIIAPRDPWVVQIISSPCPTSISSHQHSGKALGKWLRQGPLLPSKRPKVPEGALKICIALLQSVPSYPDFQQLSLIFTFRARKLTINGIKTTFTTWLLPYMDKTNNFSLKQSI